MNALPLGKPALMTVAEFADWPGDGTDSNHELIGGIPVAQAQPSPEHGTIQANITGLAFLALRDRPPCRPITEAGLAKSFRHHTMRAPDVVLTCQEPVRRTLLEATVIFEVLSPSNWADTLAKLPFYASLPGVREIVLVDSRRMEVTVYRRHDDGDDWVDAPEERLTEPGHVLRLPSMDVAMSLADIYRNVPF